MYHFILRSMLLLFIASTFIIFSVYSVPLAVRSPSGINGSPSSRTSELIRSLRTAPAEGSPLLRPISSLRDRLQSRGARRQKLHVFMTRHISLDLVLIYHEPKPIGGASSLYISADK